jgi:hypothetical protein
MYFTQASRVALHHLFAAEVGECEDRGILGEDAAGEASHGQEAVGARLHGDAEALAAAVGGVALEIFHGGVGDRVDEEVDRAELLLRPVHDGGDLVVARHVHRHEELGAGLGVGELGDTAAVPLPLVVRPVGQVGEADLAALVEDLLGDVPGDRVVVGDAENETLQTVEPAHRNLHAGWETAEWRECSRCGRIPQRGAAAGPCR